MRTRAWNKLIRACYDARHRSPKITSFWRKIWIYTHKSRSVRSPSTCISQTRCQCRPPDLNIFPKESDTATTEAALEIDFCWFHGPILTPGNWQHTENFLLPLHYGADIQGMLMASDNGEQSVWNWARLVRSMQKWFSHAIPCACIDLQAQVCFECFFKISFSTVILPKMNYLYQLEPSRLAFLLLPPSPLAAGSRSLPRRTVWETS
jgi:hypothetical protein